MGSDVARPIFGRSYITMQPVDWSRVGPHGDFHYPRPAVYARQTRFGGTKPIVGVCILGAMPVFGAGVGADRAGNLLGSGHAYHVSTRAPESWRVTERMLLK
jgi:hypothetical protein